MTRQSKRMLIAGMSGTGKTYLANQIAEQCPYPVLFIDAMYNFDSIPFKDFNGIDKKITYVQCDSNVPEQFKAIHDYCFNIYTSGKYDEPVLVIIDEAQLFCASNPEEIISFSTRSRKYFDVAFITQNPTMLTTKGRNIVISQCNELVLFHVKEPEYEMIEKKNNFTITDDMKENLKPLSDVKPSFNYFYFKQFGCEFHKGTNDSKNVEIKKDMDKGKEDM